MCVIHDFVGWWFGLDSAELLRRGGSGPADLSLVHLYSHIFLSFCCWLRAGPSNTAYLCLIWALILHQDGKSESVHNWVRMQGWSRHIQGHILFAKASLKASPDSMHGEKNSSSWWQQLQNSYSIIVWIQGRSWGNSYDHFYNSPNLA